MGRGRYRFLGPAERPDLRNAEWERVRGIALRGPDPKAWDGPTAVEVWTGGRYTISPSVYTRVYHLAVPTRNLPLWKAYLAKHGLSLNSRKRVGAHVELRDLRSVRAERVNGESVLIRTEVVSLIREHPGMYGEAESLLIDRPELE
jgi:hypothetical protein